MFQTLMPLTESEPSVARSLYPATIAELETAIAKTGPVIADKQRIPVMTRNAHAKGAQRAQLERRRDCRSKNGTTF